ncbi:MAG: hypothetical protein ACRYF4_05505 [Janthinobacterium lividum]
MKTQVLSLDFNGFQSLELVPKADDHSGCVYVLIFSKDGVEIPFYVGQTTRFLGRMDDYFWADFQAMTDFKVGEAVRYFCTPPISGRVFAKYRMCTEPRIEEASLIAKLKEQGATLLNGAKGYDYRSADEQSQAVDVRAKCDAIVAGAKNCLEAQP